MNRYLATVPPGIPERLYFGPAQRSGLLRSRRDHHDPLKPDLRYQVDCLSLIVDHLFAINDPSPTLSSLGRHRLPSLKRFIPILEFATANYWGAITTAVIIEVFPAIFNSTFLELVSIIDSANLNIGVVILADINAVAADAIIIMATIVVTTTTITTMTFADLIIITIPYHFINATTREIIYSFMVSG